MKGLIAINIIVHTSGATITVYDFYSVFITVYNEITFRNICLNILNIIINSRFIYYTETSYLLKYMFCAQFLVTLYYMGSTSKTFK